MSYHADMSKHPYPLFGYALVRVDKFLFGLCPNSDKEQVNEFISAARENMKQFFPGQDFKIQVDTFPSCETAWKWVKLKGMYLHGGGGN